MQQLTTPTDIAQLGTILSVWAHPDDESYLAAGIMATAVDNGQPVACVTATRGEAGSQDEKRWPTATLGAVRTEELQKALSVLGVKEHHWLNYPDGGCDKVSDQEAAQQIQRFIEQFQPDSILTFGPEGMTGHLDHAAVSRWVSMACEQLDSPPKIYHAVHTKEQYERHLKEADDVMNIFFNIDKPPLVDKSECAICFKLPPAIAERKRRSIAAMPSQTEVLFKHFDADFFVKAFCCEYFLSV